MDVRVLGWRSSHPRGDIPQGLAVDSAGNLYLSDPAEIREVSTATGSATSSAPPPTTTPATPGSYTFRVAANALVTASVDLTITAN